MQVLLSGAGETALQSDSDYDVQSEPGSPVNVKAPQTETSTGKIPVTKTFLKMLVTERQSEG